MKSLKSVLQLVGALAPTLVVAILLSNPLTGKWITSSELLVSVVMVSSLLFTAIVITAANRIDTSAKINNSTISKSITNIIQAVEKRGNKAHG